MSAKQIIMWQVAREHWQGGADRETAISPFVRDALDIERRLPKGVNLGNERVRYQLCCRRIQNAVLEDSLADIGEPLSSDIFSLLQNLATRSHSAIQDARLAACFFPPGLVGRATEAMAALAKAFADDTVPGMNALKERLSFFQNAEDASAGVVETLDFLNDTAAFQPLPTMPRPGRSPEPQSMAPAPAAGLHSPDASTACQHLLATVEQAIRSGTAVNFSNQPNPVITEVLNSMVYADKGRNPTLVRVVYMDGTEAEPFPVRCLPRKEPETGFADAIRLRAALVSMRHLEMDSDVDLAWFRNRQVSAGGSFAEVDAFCTGQTLDLLREMPGERARTLELYQTGLETAVIGFYRGLVRFFLEQQGNRPLFQVQPMYYLGKAGEYRKGQPWA